MSVGVSGYMQQWFGMSSVDANTAATPLSRGGVSQYSDSEIFFKGKLEADNGLAFSVKVEIEGNTHPDVVDESQLTVSGSFGQIVLGSEDDAATIMHYGNKDVGVGLNCGDASFINGLTTCARSNGKGLGTAGHLIGGDSQKIAYYTPRFNGVQFGVSYSPESVEDSGAGSPTDNDNDAISLGLNMKQDVGDASVGISAGHYSKQGMPGNDEQTFSNFGLQVGFGAFGFDVAYAEHDDGDDMNKAADYEVASAGVNYTDGPMALSLSHMTADAADDSEVNATMLSLSYSLAPGIASNTSIIAGEQDTAEGTAFVTGFTLSF